ncbi:MAG: hypothetical protein HZC42_09995 [Candidatus Eisenbacteria bacterium]|nr:hypothetical protein [Candidatus Eisenbacteria bacterium]
MRPRVLVVDDDSDRAATIVYALQRDFACEVACSADQALRALSVGGWAAVAVDFDLASDGTGFTVLRGAVMLAERAARVLYTSYFSGGLAQEAARTAHAQAALDARPAGFLDELRCTLCTLVNARAPELPAWPEPGSADASAWCAASTRTQRFLDELRPAAESCATTYVHGESGSGRHLARRTLCEWRRVWAGRAGLEWRRVNPQEPVRVIAVPPLRERVEDIPGLCARAFAPDGLTPPRPAKRLGPDALRNLMERDWQGNVRELQGVLWRAAQRARDRAEIVASDLPRDALPRDAILHAAKEEGQREAVLLCLRTVRTVSAAARLAGMTRPNFKRLMSRHGVLRADPGAHDPEADDA